MCTWCIKPRKHAVSTIGAVIIQWLRHKGYRINSKGLVYFRQFNRLGSLMVEYVIVNNIYLTIYFYYLYLLYNSYNIY